MKYLDILNSRIRKHISRISTRLLGLEFKSDNIIKSKAMEFIVNKILSDY